MARYYDPNIGRFITRDTFHGFEEDPLSLNQYAYAKGNPVKFIDPSGHWVWFVLKAAIGGATNALPVFIQYYKNHGSNWRKITAKEWLRIGTAFVVGAITTGLGIKYFQVVGKLGVSWTAELIAKINYGAKAYIINTLARGQSPTLGGLAKQVYNSIYNKMFELKRVFK